jgi:hypothetical protein
VSKFSNAVGEYDCRQDICHNRITTCSRIAPVTVNRFPYFTASAFQFMPRNSSRSLYPNRVRVDRYRSFTHTVVAMAPTETENLQRDNHDALIAAAKALAERVHQGQQRKYSGENYISHPRRVADAVGSPIEKACAWLHDALEDAPDREMVQQALKQFPSEVETAVQALTRHENESYEQYIERVAENRLATIVKLADLRDNLRDLESGELKERYLKAQARLETVVQPLKQSVSIEDVTADVVSGKRTFLGSKAAHALQIIGAVGLPQSRRKHNLPT